MQSFEQEFKSYIASTTLRLVDNTSSLTQLDFTLTGRETFHLELKEKRQHLRLASWPGVEWPEEHAFILDDLSARKIYLAGPNAGLAVRDNLSGLYYFFTALDLLEMPKIRYNRTILLGEQETLKGKWAINLRHGELCINIGGILVAITNYLLAKEQLFSQSACYGDFLGENIQPGGITRNREHFTTDYTETR